MRITDVPEADLTPWVGAFIAAGYSRQAIERFSACWKEQDSEARHVLLAWQDAVSAGYRTIWWRAEYPYFDQAIPEMRDFNVIGSSQGRGIGSRLLAHAERMVAALKAHRHRGRTASWIRPGAAAREQRLHSGWTRPLLPQ